MSENTKETGHIRDREFKKSEKLTEDGWLTPSGIYYECDPDEHDKLALWLTKDAGWSEKELLEEGLTPRQLLQDWGYIQMSQGVPFLPKGNITRNQVETFTKSDVQIPVRVNDLSEKSKSDFFNKVEPSLTNDERNIVAAIVANDSSETNIWDNKELTRSILEKITKRFSPRKRVQLTGYRGASEGSYYQYWVDEENDIAIGHQHHIHAGDSAHWYNAPILDERLRLTTPKKAKQSFERNKKFWEGKSVIEDAHID